MVKSPTHDKGRIIDHFYVPKEVSEKMLVKLAYPYFTDHAAICIKFVNIE